MFLRCVQVIAYQPDNTMRNGYVPVLEADHKEAVHRGQRLPAAASMAHGLCREAACRRDALCSSSPVPAAAQCSMPEVYLVKPSFHTVF